MTSAIFIEKLATNYYNRIEQFFLSYQKQNPGGKKGASCNQEMSYSFIFQTECFEVVQYFSQPVKNLF